MNPCVSLQSEVISDIRLFFAEQISAKNLGSRLTGLNFDPRYTADVRKRCLALVHLIEDVGPDIEFQQPSASDLRTLRAYLDEFRRCHERAK